VSAAPDIVELPGCDCDEDNRVLTVQNPYLQGEDVEYIQHVLARALLYSEATDGVYDEALARAVSTWQGNHGLKPTGVVDEPTWHTLLHEDWETLSVLPSAAPAPPVFILIDVDRNTLTLYSQGKPYKTYDVATGMTDWPTPIGEWRIINKDKDWGDGFGVRWMQFSAPWGIYGIHGTNKPWSIGRDESHGCVRMHNEDVIELFGWVQIGTPVLTTNSNPRPLNPTLSIRSGAVGRGVVNLQSHLRDWGFYHGATDGVYGPETKLAVERFEEHFHLEKDGIFARDQWQYLKEHEWYSDIGR
jgi:lipoprotein-anchoring transpeptidase ErfK/SrfK